MKHRADHAGPVPDSERIVTLDVLRGFALSGILLANIFLFALPAGSNGVVTGADLTVRLLVSFLVEGKFYVVLCLLLGMGLRLQSGRLRRRGHNGAVSVRRLIFLFVIGLVHAVLLFSADILAFYAVCGLIVLPFRNLSDQALLRLASGLYLSGLLALGGYAWAHPEEPFPTTQSWGDLADRATRTTRSTDTDTGHDRFVRWVTRSIGTSEENLYRFMADEERIFREGNATEMILHRTVSFVLFAMPLRLLYLGWQVCALFLFGMSLVGRVSAKDPESLVPRFRRLAIGGFAVGMFLQLVGGAAQSMTAGLSALGPVFVITTFSGTLVLGLSYASFVALICSRWSESLPVLYLAAMGRTALTNYIAQSVLCGLLFYGFGLGLFGRLNASQAVLLVFPILLFQLLCSATWLRFFRFGPMEWIWRTLTYGKFQRIR